MERKNGIELSGHASWADGVARLLDEERDTDPEITKDVEVTKDYVRPPRARRLGLIGRLRLWLGVWLVRRGTQVIP